jgi:putative ABC transport system ATP-binding protein
MLRDAHLAAAAAAPALRLTVEGLRVCARDGRDLLRVDRLTAPAGAALGVRGPSGAGKSTLLHALAGLLRPAEGRVLWGETDLAALSEARRDAFRRRGVGMIFQDFQLFEELGALDNAAVSAAFAPAAERAAIRRRAAEALERLGLDPGARDVSRMSGGERQRVAVARALAADPPAILADEPTASLDRASADRLIADLTAIVRARGATLIAVSHDPAVQAAMDRVVTVADGRLAP